jgi:hypothetical protein
MTNFQDLHMQSASIGDQVPGHPANALRRWTISCSQREDTKKLHARGQKIFLRWVGGNKVRLTCNMPGQRKGAAAEGPTATFVCQKLPAW